MSANALTVARFLEKHERISRVRYPGLENDPGHIVACRQMHDGFGGVLAFEVGQRREDAMRFIGGLKTIYHAVSLGATESLVCIPYLTTMLYMPPERRLGFGVKENTVRFSAGIEREEELIGDIERALRNI